MMARSPRQRRRVRTQPAANALKYGESYMPIREILLTIRKEKWTWVPMIEPTSIADTALNVGDLRSGLGYCKGVLA